MSPLRIGVFDSGVGGLSILRELRDRLPGATLHYIADAGHAPYGERSNEHVQQRSLRLSRQLLDDGANAIVVACNSATAVASQRLRETWPRTAFVGVEPGIKPAVASTRNGRIGVMATRATLGSEKFQRLAAATRGDASLHLRACDGLAAAIELGHFDDPALLALIEQHCAPLRDAGVDTVVLGCTHYGFARRQIHTALGADVQIIDTAAAVARQAANIVRPRPRNHEPGPARPSILHLQTTGDPAQLQRVANAWLGTTTDVSVVDDGAQSER